MHIEALTDKSLIDLLQLIREAQWADDAIDEGEKRFGVREYPDWRKQAEAFEAELSRRQVAFTPVDW